MGRFRTLPDIPCVGCSKLFRPRNSDKKYCSVSCFNANRPKMGKGRVVKCEQCGKDFWKFNNQIKRTNKNFCSVSCTHRSLENKVILSCKYCGNEYKTIPGQIKHRGSSFCSRKCGGLFKRTQTGEKSVSWKGGVSDPLRRLRSSAAFKEWRAAVFERDNHICQHCGSRERLEPHHIKRFALYSDLRFEVSNGLTLCNHCHNKIKEEVINVGKTTQKK